MFEEMFELLTPEGSLVFSKDRVGEPCVTEEGLDAIWPIEDGVEPLVITSKWFELPPTCGTSLADRFTDEELLAFVFNGSEIHSTIPAVPLPASFFMLASAIALLFWRKFNVSKN